jgi:predicted enzyme related to lactoylglutathione lyase
MGAGRGARRRVYGAVLGLDYLPAHEQRGRQAPGSVPPQGLWEAADGPALFCSYVVDDAAAAVARVRAAGGRAEEPVTRPYGLTAECVDADGVRFALHQPLAGSPGPAQPPAGGSGHDGDLAYLTLEVADPARTLEFYGAVLGWRWRPGRSPGGWQVEDTTPMIGVSGGHAAPAAWPVWQVTDLAAAVARVRAAGGTATEPHQEPYGLMADCTDDLGFRFTLGQFPG